MKVLISTLTEEGVYNKVEYIAREIRGTDRLLALDIEGIGWRAFELKEISGYVIKE